MVLQLAEELSRGEEGGQVGPEGQKLLDFLQAMKVLGEQGLKNEHRKRNGKNRPGTHAVCVPGLFLSVFRRRLQHGGLLLLLRRVHLQVLLLQRLAAVAALQTAQPSDQTALSSSTPSSSSNQSPTFRRSSAESVL